MGGLNWETTEDTLRNYFERFGLVDEVSTALFSCGLNSGCGVRLEGEGLLLIIMPLDSCCQVIILKDWETKKSRGFGFVTFGDREVRSWELEGVPRPPPLASNGHPDDPTPDPLI